jgi:hypothetical protein
MEGQPIEISQLVQISVGSIITIASAIVVALSGTIAILFRMLESKNDKIIKLTESYIETTIGVKTALENNTKVIEKFPDTILMQIRASK